MPELFKRGDEVVLVIEPDDGGPGIGCRGVVVHVDRHTDQNRGYLINVSWQTTTWSDGNSAWDVDDKEWHNCWWVHGDCLNYDSPRNFYLIGIIDGKEVVLKDEPTFDLGAEAAEHARKLTVLRGYKVQPRRFAATDSDAWRKREELRIADGTYMPMPEGWNLEPIKDHFLHRAKDEPYMVAYTESPERGVLDRQTRTTPGRYLERFYPDLPQEARKHLIALVDGPNGVCFAKTEDEIVQVYLRGPNSCMSHKLSDYESECHPVAVYGDSDLQVAYLKDDSRITARALVWPEKKLIGRMYGDCARLRTALVDLGYREGPDLTGARVRKIWDEDRETYVAPYVDNAGGLHDPDPEDPEAFLVITRSGNVYAEHTNGFGSYRKWCPKSRHWCDASYFRFVHGANEEWAVDNCRHYIVAVAGEYWAKEYCVELAGRGWYPKSKVDAEKFALSDVSNKPIMPEDLLTMANGKVISRQERHHTTTCSGNGKLYLLTDVEYVRGSYYSLEYLAQHPETHVSTPRRGEPTEPMLVALDAKMREWSAAVEAPPRRVARSRDAATIEW